MKQKTGQPRKKTKSSRIIAGRPPKEATSINSPKTPHMNHHSAPMRLTTKLLHGLNLRVYIDSGNATMVDISRILGISRQSLYAVYGEQVLKREFIEKLNKAKVFVPGLNADGGFVLQETHDELLKQLENYKELADSRKQTIEYQKRLLEGK